MTAISDGLGRAVAHAAPRTAVYDAIPVLAVAAFAFGAYYGASASASRRHEKAAVVPAVASVYPRKYRKLWGFRPAESEAGVRPLRRRRSAVGRWFPENARREKEPC